MCYSYVSPFLSYYGPFGVISFWYGEVSFLPFQHKCESRLTAKIVQPDNSWLLRMTIESIAEIQAKQQVAMPSIFTNTRRAKGTKAIKQYYFSSYNRIELLLGSNMDWTADLELSCKPSPCI